MRKMTYLCAALLALPCVSCRKDSLHPVTGSVMYNGTPAAGATVFLHRQGTSSGPVMLGAVHDDGTFEIVCGSDGKGAPPGDYDVLIVWRTVCAETKSCCQRRTDKLQGRYADRSNPPFRVSINSGRNELPAFDVTALR